jgi:hypothetical protein
LRSSIVEYVRPVSQGEISFDEVMCSNFKLT